MKESYHKDFPEEWTVKPMVVTYAASQDIDTHKESEEKFRNDNKYEVY